MHAHVDFTPPLLSGVDFQWSVLPHLGACPDSVRRCGELEGIGGSGGGFGRFGRVGGVQAVASLAVDRLRPWASLSMLWARQTRPHSLATLSSPRIRN